MVSTLSSAIPDKILSNCSRTDKACSGRVQTLSMRSEKWACTIFRLQSLGIIKFAQARMLTESNDHVISTPRSAMRPSGAAVVLSSIGDTCLLTYNVDATIATLDG